MMTTGDTGQAGAAHQRSGCIRCGRTVAVGRGESILYPHRCIGVMPAGLYVMFLHGPTLHKADWSAG